MSNSYDVISDMFTEAINCGGATAELIRELVSSAAEENMLSDAIDLIDRQQAACVSDGEPKYKACEKARRLLYRAYANTGGTYCVVITNSFSDDVSVFEFDEEDVQEGLESLYRTFLSEDVAEGNDIIEDDCYCMDGYAQIMFGGDEWQHFEVCTVTDGYQEKIL